jgi:hypothetical protein
MFGISEPFKDNMFLPQRAYVNLKLGITVSLYYKNEHSTTLGLSHMDHT